MIEREYNAVIYTLIPVNAILCASDDPLMTEGMA
jgi:hypothetical protein